MKQHDPGSTTSLGRAVCNSYGIQTQHNVVETKQMPINSNVVPSRLGRQHGRLRLAGVKGGRAVHCLVLQVVQQRLGGQGAQPALSVAHGGGRVVVQAAEVAVAWGR